jgi:hypothetical protein
MEHKPLFEVKKQYAGTVTKYKISKIKSNPLGDYKDELLKHIAVITRKFLLDNPRFLPQVMPILEGIDSRIFKQETIDRSVKLEVIATLMCRLNSLTNT